MNRQAEAEFHKLLGALAMQCGTELDKFTIGLYDKHLSKHGYEAVNGVLEAILVERAPTDRFPPIGTILARLGALITPKSLITDVTNKIAVAIRTKGNNWIDKVAHPSAPPEVVEAAFKADQLRVLGEAGVEVVKRLGGWTAVVEMSSENPKYYLNWVRDSVTAVVESGGSRYLTLLPKPEPQRPQIQGPSLEAPSSAKQR